MSISDRVNITCGDCLEVMKGIDENSIDSIVTDPPYGLKFMGKKWDHGIMGDRVWEAALRIAKPGAHLLAFGGTRTFHRLAVAIENAGWIIRDTIGWIYGSGFPKSHNLKGDWTGWGTALKPAWEPVIMARKGFKGTVASNVLEHGTGAINIDDCRVKTTGKDPNDRTDKGKGKHKDNSAFGVSGMGQWQASQGRWPANIIHDGSDEVLEVFPETGQSPKTYMRNKDSGNVDIYSKGIGELAGKESLNYGDKGSATRFFYCAKASRKERNAGLEGMEKRVINITEGHGRGAINTSKGDGTGIRENRPRQNFHPTVKPIALMRYLCRLVTPPGGLVFDPFMGSCSTGVAAIQEGFDFIGCDIEPEYVRIAKIRMKAALAVG